MSVNQELSERDITQRTSLIVYLRNASNDQFKLRRYGDIVYFSKKLHYLILYVNQAEAEERPSAGGVPATHQVTSAVIWA